MKLPIYLDYSATTPVDRVLAEKMMQFLTMDGTLVTRPPVPTVLAGRLKRRLISPAIRLPSWSAPTRAKSSLPLVRLNPTTWRSKGAANFYQKKRQAHHHQQNRGIKRFWIPAVSWSAKASK
ncbi:cysteine desulfurase [Klebsiella pneumoniae]|uniref:Cysteine desulfurase n=1 Tax=Klebsiella pneumoniae TaxID=573 RepID=A0A3S5DH81_KLEPN|nr:cysteine desulfurase [Klebsiella pneumoniae]